MTIRTLRQLCAAALTCMLASCGSSGTTTEGAQSAAPGTETTTASGPKAIVSLSPTATETLFAIGAGRQVIAVDDQSSFPTEAPRTDLSGFTPNVEAIVAKKPDLVVFADNAELAESLTKLGIPVLSQPAAATIDDAYAQIVEIGKRSGHAAEAAALVTSMRQRIDFAVRQAPKVALTYYHELDDTLYSVTSKTFIGSVYALFGLQNIADAADKDATGYPQLSAEYIAKADPDLIFLADAKCCKQNPASIAARPGFSGLKAVARNQILALDDDIPSRWGPRIADFAEIISRKLAAFPLEVKAA